MNSTDVAAYSVISSSLFCALFSKEMNDDSTAGLSREGRISSSVFTSGDKLLRAVAGCCYPAPSPLKIAFCNLFFSFFLFLLALGEN